MGADTWGMTGVRPPIQREQVLSGLAAISAWAVFLLGAWVVGEWTVGALRVAWPSTRWLAMAPSTGLAFMALGALLGAGPRLRAREANAAWLVPPLLLALGCLWALHHHGTSAPLPSIWALPIQALPGRPFFGRMSPTAAVALLLAAAALGLRFREAGALPWRLSVSQGLSLGLGVASGALIASFGFGAPVLQEGRIALVAPPAVVGFLLLSVGQLTAGERSWGRRWLTSPSLLARLTRKTIPAMLLVVVAGGWATGAVLEHAAGPGRLIGAAVVTVLAAGLVALITARVAARIQGEVDRAQSGLREQVEFQRATLNSVGEGVLSTDLEGRMVGLNPVAAALTGWPLEEALGRPHGEVLNLLDPGDRRPLADLTEPVLWHGEAYASPGPSLLVARDGTERRVLEHAAPMRDEAGAVVGMVIAIRDMTTYLELEEKLRQAQKMEAIGQLAGGIAHDFNNMLSAIQGGAELMAMRAALDSEQAGYVRMIKDGTMRAADLVAKLLAFSRKGKVVSTGVDVHEIVQATCAILARSIDPRIRVEMKLDARGSVMVGDPTTLQHLFLNLGINARDAMPEGGRLLFATANRHLGEGEALPDLQAGPCLDVVVEDTGCGIPPGIRDRIFEPFFTTKPAGQGTGLGLASVYAAVKEHRGAISVESEPGKGTRFRLTFPVDEAPAYPVRTPEELVPHGHGRVLVIDDEPLVRTVAFGMLKSLGYSALLAEDGEAGLDLYRREGDRIDAVIVDLVMPRLGGLETIQALRALDPGVRVLLCSGFDLESRLGRPGWGWSGPFLQKPYRRADLAAALARLVALPT